LKVRILGSELFSLKFLVNTGDIENRVFFLGTRDPYRRVHQV